MNYSYAGLEYDPNYLAHYGTPRMRWGVRRYQNKDGSLTPEGKERYAKLNKKYEKTMDRASQHQSLAKQAESKYYEKDVVTRKNKLDYEKKKRNYEWMGDSLLGNINKRGSEKNYRKYKKMEAETLKYETLWREHDKKASRYSKRGEKIVAKMLKELNMKPAKLLE